MILSLRVDQSADAMQMGRNEKSLPLRHSRAGGNPGFSAWIPGLALLARNDGLLSGLARERAFCF
jgi:hypothetical protein